MTENLILNLIVVAWHGYKIKYRDKHLNMVSNQYNQEGIYHKLVSKLGYYNWCSNHVDKTVGGITDSLL